MAKTTINDYVITVEFKELADAWDFCDRNNLPRPARIMEKSDNTHPYLKGPNEWSKLRFWHNWEPGKIKYSQKAKDYYDQWLSDMYKNERVNTNLQTGIQ